MTDSPSPVLPDDVDALKALVREQAEQLAALRQRDRRINELRAEQATLVDALSAENAKLREQLNLALARHYGVSRESVPDEQLRLFNEAEAEQADTEPEAQTVEVAAHTRVRRGGRRELDPKLPRVVLNHELAESERVCPHDGATLERIGEETSEQLDIVPAKVRVLRHVRGKYACRACERTVRTAPLPPQPIPKSQASPGLLAHVTVSKYLDGLPLYRLERIFERLGADVDRGTLATWMIKCAALLQPLVNLLRDELLSQDVLHGDETTVQVLNEPGRAPQTKSYMWVQTSARFAERQVVLFEYSPSRSATVAKRLYGEFSGYLHLDGYAAYNAVCAQNDITAIGCWAHVRRKLNDALKAAGIQPDRPPPKGKPPPANARKAARALAFLKQLFAIEHRIRYEPPSERQRVRQLESAPVIERLHQWLEETQPLVPPQSALGRALAYLHDQWPRLLVYLDDGRLEMTNNRAERAIRPFVIGRKAWLFSNTVRGVKASANLYSLIETARGNGHEPYLWLRHVFTELPKASTAEDIESLLPYNIEPSRLGSDHA